jgi:hypothetical protein
VSDLVLDYMECNESRCSLRSRSRIVGWHGRSLRTRYANETHDRKPPKSPPSIAAEPIGSGDGQRRKQLLDRTAMRYRRSTASQTIQLLSSHFLAAHRVPTERKSPAPASIAEDVDLNSSAGALRRAPMWCRLGPRCAISRGLPAISHAETTLLMLLHIRQYIRSRAALR